MSDFTVLTKEEGWRQCAVGQRTTQFCGLLEAAVLAERERCAKVCELLELGERFNESSDRTVGWEEGTVDCAAAIRALDEEK